MTFREALKSGKFVVTAEVGPPKGVDMKEFMENAELLRPRVQAINVTDQQSAVMRVGSLTGARILKEHGIEPIFQMTCRDRNRIALQSDLLSAYVSGVENVLCLTGDHTTSGDHPTATPVFDLDSVSLLHAARQLEQGKDLAGKDLKGVPHFYLGACVTPGTEPNYAQLLKMEKKVKAGAQFFQTQAVYEPQKFERFMKEAARFGVPVMVGIVLIRSVAMARFMNKNVAGVFVPDSLMDEMDKAQNKAQKSIEIAARLINDMKGLCQGVHIMAIGLEARVPPVLDACNL